MSIVSMLFGSGSTRNIARNTVYLLSKISKSGWLTSKTGWHDKETDQTAHFSMFFWVLRSAMTYCSGGFDSAAWWHIPSASSFAPRPVDRHASMVRRVIGNIVSSFLEPLRRNARGSYWTMDDVSWENRKKWPNCTHRLLLYSSDSRSDRLHSCSNSLYLPNRRRYRRERSSSRQQDADGGTR